MVPPDCSSLRQSIYLMRPHPRELCRAIKAVRAIVMGIKVKVRIKEILWKGMAVQLMDLCVIYKIKRWAFCVDCFVV